MSILRPIASPEMTLPSDLPEKAFRSHAPGYWNGQNIAPSDWSNATWQLKNRITTLAQLEENLVLSQEERAGVLLSGDRKSVV